MRAYNESYINKAKKNLGNMFDFAINMAGESGDEFWYQFAHSDLAKQFENGNPKFIVGRSGEELYYDTFATSKKDIFSAPINHYSKTPEYWCGWILAYYQWYYNANFKNINDKLSFDKLLNLYHPLHTVGEQEAVEVLRKWVNPISEPTKLETIREARALSQKDLASLSGISLRTIQSYEQRNRDINKAQGDMLRAISKTLNCSIEELFE